MPERRAAGYEIVDNLRTLGTGGRGLQNEISVQMLSQGWDVAFQTAQIQDIIQKHSGS